MFFVPTVTVELTAETVGFGDTVKVTEPFPVPAPPDKTVTPGLCEVTPQGQPAGAVTVMTTVPPESGTVAGVVAE
jgi:hypothetical protein